MGEQFYIKKGAFCFIIPIFTDNSKICNEYFGLLNKGLKEFKELKEKKREFITEWKSKFADALRKDNTEPTTTSLQETQKPSNDAPRSGLDVSPNFCQKECKNIDKYKDEYKGRFLCKCVASAIKFHDDKSQQKSAAHFYLGKHDVEYQNIVNVKFSFNAVLYLTHEDKEKAAYLVIEINKEDIKDFSITNQGKPAGTITAEQIIFIKHLFYKQKMEVTIDNEEKCSIQNWLVKYLDKLCKGLGIKKDDIPEYVFEHAFDYSVIELKEICDKDGNDINIKFNDIDADFNEYYAKQTYGMLLSDEGWNNTPYKVVKDKLKDYWTTRDYLCTFFLQRNALLFNLKDEKYTNFCQEWFKAYPGDKYREYTQRVPCLTGIDSLAIFPFLKAIYKEIKIVRYEKTYRVDETKNIEEKDITKTKNELEKLQQVINDTSINLGEIAYMEKCIYSQFGMIERVQRIKELYEQQVDRLNFLYESENNRKIKILTWVTVGVGVLTLILDCWQAFK